MKRVPIVAALFTMTFLSSCYVEAGGGGYHHGRGRTWPQAWYRDMCSKKSGGNCIW